MKKVKFPVLFSTFYLLLHSISPYLGVPESVIIASWMLSPLLVIWMVVRVLKDGVPSDKTFDEHFYEDFSYHRLNDGNSRDENDEELD